MPHWEIIGKKKIVSGVISQGIEASIIPDLIYTIPNVLCISDVTDLILHQLVKAVLSSHPSQPSTINFLTNNKITKQNLIEAHLKHP